MINYEPNTSRIAFIQSTLCDPNDKLWSLFSALGDCARYRITKVLMYHRNLSVTELAHILQISVPATSQQLKILEAAGIVGKKRSGQVVYYHLTDSNPFIGRALKLIEAWIEDESQKKGA